VLVFLDHRISAQKIRKAVASHLSQHGLSAELVSTSIAPQGARTKL